MQIKNLFEQLKKPRINARLKKRAIKLWNDAQRSTGLIEIKIFIRIMIAKVVVKFK